MRIRRIRSLAPAVLVALVAGALASCTSPPASESTPSASQSASATPASPQPSASPSGITSQTGGIVDGFPSSVIPVPPDATVLLSTIAPTEGGLDAVSLSIDSTDTSANLMAFYASSITAAGFTQIPPSSADVGGANTQQATFSRGDSGEMLQVTVIDDGSVRHVTVGGRIAPGS